MTEAVRHLVRQRAQHRCEYCQLHQDDSPLAALHIEHIRPIKHGGTDAVENLCLACIDCNLHKGTNLTGIDPETDEITPLFHPRRDNWDEHFIWNGIRIAGRTAVGRATVRVLDLNGDDRLDLRMA
ncbi:MAG: HNH endonuclease [Prosthecobacter sp.]|jgi:5-methylcytosine-specific restriction endonuclease McrA|uniref:HNH endonuclease n=1 Tax=Prosthecobacter sp. TaxID=1965333 RepID=UPI001A023519|nr:HNH endonuclease [Prosthecobacter sp.]MBE2287463.1 HNH endonuclease [Prosthecobacter sp.]